VSKLKLIRVILGTAAVAALTIVLGAASPAQAAGLKNCGDNGIVAPCFENVWSNGVQVKMTFVQFNPAPSNAPTRNFYVIAPQTGAPQGWAPFLHDHVIGELSPQNHQVRYHAFFVMCSGQGIVSGGCVPTMTAIPGFGTIPFANSVNGQRLTSTETIESAANAGLVTLFDTGGSILATINTQQ